MALNKRTLPGPNTKGTLTQQVKSLQRVVAKLRPELKYLDTSLDSSNVTTAGRVIHLTGIPQGDTRSTRTGETVNVTSVYCSGSFVRTTDETYVSNAMYRCFLFVDKDQVADTVPSVANVMQNPAEPTGPIPNLDFLERFRILWISPIKDGSEMHISHIAVVSNASVPATQSRWIEYEWKGSLKVGFNGANGTDIQKNGVYFGIMSNDTGDIIDFDGTARIGYTDV